MVEDRSTTRLESTGRVWITSEEYEEWNVASSPFWIITDKDVMADMILIERVSLSDTEEEE